MMVAILLSIGSLSKISNRQTEQDQLEQELSEIEGKLTNYFITSIEGGDLANAYNNTETSSNSYTKRIISEMKDNLVDIGNEISQGKPSYYDLKREILIEKIWKIQEEHHSLINSNSQKNKKIFFGPRI